MNSTYPIYTGMTDCQDCYKCVRHCPVKAILILAGTPGQNAGANFLEINKAGLCISSKEGVC